MLQVRSDYFGCYLPIYFRRQREGDNVAYILERCQFYFTKMEELNAITAVPCTGGVTLHYADFKVRIVKFQRSSYRAYFTKMKGFKVSFEVNLSLTRLTKDDPLKLARFVESKAGMQLDPGLFGREYL